VSESNFDKMGDAPRFARASGAPESPAPFGGYALGKGTDGRTLRRSGRVVQFGTVVSPEFKRWMKTKAALKDKSMAALLDDMRAAYIQIHGE
jgi:hypothetical protein